MSADTSYGGPQHAPWLTIAILVGVYVLIVISVWRHRFHSDDKERSRQVKQAQLMREIRQYGPGEWTEQDEP